MSVATMRTRASIICSLLGRRGGEAAFRDMPSAGADPGDPESMAATLLPLPHVAPRDPVNVAVLSRLIARDQREVCSKEKRTQWHAPCTKTSARLRCLREGDMRASRLVPIVLFSALLAAVPFHAALAATAPDLRSAGSFAVLAG